jgi:hypothetical protein
MKILGSVWFTPAGNMGVIGVVRVQNEMGLIKYYIGTAYGVDEETDAEHIANYGAKFPTKAGEEIF